MTAQLSLAQLYTRSGQYAKAVQELEQKPNGTLTLVLASDPVTDTGNLRSETLKVALRAYVGTLDQEKA